MPLGAGASTALRTDHYELTMLDAALRSGVATKRAVFELFTRRLPDGRRYGVVGGIGRIADAVERFTFGDEELAFLERADVVGPSTIQHLAAYRFAGTIRAYREGELHFPHSPVVTVECTFGDGLVLETLLLSIVNHDSAIAAAASRMVTAAAGRPIIEMGGRRTHEDAAVAAARMAYLCGFGSTSNLEAGRRHGVPTRGTAAHAFTLAHADELAAFRAQVVAAGPNTTLLVDTYDIAQGIRNGVDAAGPELGAIRIDSGDPASETRKARSLLDELGATRTRIVVTGDLDEHSIEQLVVGGAPIDGFGVGTSVVTGSGHPTAGFVYKLVAIEDEDGTMRPVAKRSADKTNAAGAKRAARLVDEHGWAVAERFTTGGRPPPEGRPLQVDLVVDGDAVHRPTNDEIRAHHVAALAELRPDDRATAPGPPVLTATEEPR